MTGEQSFEERFGFKAKGEFRCKGWFEIPLTVFGLAIIVPGGLAIFQFLADPFKTFGGGLPAVPFALAVWALFCWWIVRIAHTGVTYRYDADEKEYRITDPKRNVVTFYYADIVSVDYKPLYYIHRKLRGYRVTINTKYRAFSYNYIFSNRKVHTKPEDTPFFIIEQRAGLAKGFIREGGAVRTGEDNNEKS